MQPKNKVTVSVRPTNIRPNTAERRAAQVAIDATKQATLKDEAAKRRRERELRADAPPTKGRGHKP
jgi:hypothetical protein